MQDTTTLGASASTRRKNNVHGKLMATRKVRRLSWGAFGQFQLASRTISLQPPRQLEQRYPLGQW
jgi:hypothetical protein